MYLFDEMELHLNCMNEFDFAIERMHLAVPDTLDEQMIAEAMEVALSTFRTWKHRRTIQQGAMIRFCLHYKVNLNWFFYGKGDPTLEEDFYSLSFSKSMYNNMREGIKLVSIEMNRLDLPFEDEIMDTLIQTYFKYNSLTDVDITQVVRAVAETFVPLDY